MQIETYKPDKLNLNEFIEHYNISLILNNEIIRIGGFELINYDELLEAEKENFLLDYEDEILEAANKTARNEILTGSSLEAIRQVNEILEAEKDNFLYEHEDEISEAVFNRDIYQYFIISEMDVQYIKKYLPYYEIFYNEDIEVYLLGIGHWGMSWSFFFTEAPRPEYMKIPKYDKILLKE